MNIIDYGLMNDFWKLKDGELGFKPGELHTFVSAVGGKSNFSKVILNQMYGRGLRSSSNFILDSNPFVFDASQPFTLELNYEHVSPNVARFRRHQVRVFMNTEVGTSIMVCLNKELTKKIDAWCTSAFGRGYKKPLARWYRRHKTHTYEFRDKQDAAAFKFYFQSMAIEDNKFPHELEPK